jgi:hypothetical protein
MTNAKSLTTLLIATLVLASQVMQRVMKVLLQSQAHRTALAIESLARLLWAVR